MAPLRQEVVGLCLLETQPAEAHALHVDVERADELVGLGPPPSSTKRRYVTLLSSRSAPSIGRFSYTACVRPP